MKRTRMIALGLLAPLAAACSTATAQAPMASQTTPATAATPTPVATAALRTASGADAGTVTMYRGALGMLMRVEGRGWPAGWHGVHLHATGTCEGPKFTSAGAHVNHPDQARPHGLLNPAGGPDLGDLQNVWAHADGTVMAEVYLADVGSTRRGQDLMDADGVAFLVHANPDDHVSQPIGGAGDRIACGVFTSAG